jgi:hypothetical protein
MRVKITYKYLILVATMLLLSQDLYASSQPSAQQTGVPTSTASEEEPWNAPTRASAQAISTSYEEIKKVQQAEEARKAREKAAKPTEAAKPEVQSAKAEQATSAVVSPISSETAKEESETLKISSILSDVIDSDLQKDLQKSKDVADKEEKLFFQSELGLTDRIIAGTTWNVYSYQQLAYTTIIPLIKFILKNAEIIKNKFDQANKKIDAIKTK